MRALFFGSPLKTLSNKNPLSLVSPSAKIFLDSAKTPVNNFLCFETKSAILGFNSSNSCLSPFGVGPDIIRGVLASSIKTESTSSIIA